MLAGLIEEYQKLIQEEVDRTKRISGAINVGVFPGAMPPMQPPKILSQSDLVDAMAYAKAQGVMTPKQKTPKELAMMGTYNVRSPDEDFYIKLLGMRLRVKEGEMIPFEYIGCHHNTASGDVHLMIVKDNEAVTFKESGAIFPSDETIAKLHLIINK